MKKWLPLAWLTAAALLYHGHQAAAFEIDSGVTAKFYVTVPTHLEAGEKAVPRFSFSIRNNRPFTDKAPWEEREYYERRIDFRSTTAQALGILGFGPVNDAARAAAEAIVNNRGPKD